MSPTSRVFSTLDHPERVHRPWGVGERDWTVPLSPQTAGLPMATLHTVVGPLETGVWREAIGQLVWRLNVGSRCGLVS